MDFNEKDAARSKHKLSKKNQRGRGRGRGGWRVPSATTRQTRDLGTNIDRYGSDEGLEQPSEGPVRQSQGADLAEWLDHYPAEDPFFHARQRVNLHQKVGLPPAELDTFQGLSFDLKGLAECLSKLPLHEVLRVPPPVDENGNMVVTVEEEESIDNNNTSIPSGYIPSGNYVSVSTSEGGPPENLEVVAKPPPPKKTSEPVAAKTETLPQPQPAVEVTNKLHFININSAEDEIDDELDALLGLGEKTKYNTSGVGPKESTSGEKEESLEAWLDNL